jgi:DNA-binding transcriptional regulator YhcF (GntR family)
MPERSKNEWIESLLATLQQMPNVRASQIEEIETQPDSGFDFAVDASINAKPVRLLVQTKNTVFPRDVRASYWQLMSASGRSSGKKESSAVIPMIAASTISDGAKQLLQNERIGYFEQGGSLFLADDDVFVLIDKPATKMDRKIDRPLFSGNRASVIHALLMNPTRWFSTHELAQMIFVSPSTVSVVLTELEKRDFANTQGRGPNKTRQVSRPGALLDEWAKQVSIQKKPTIRRYFVPLAKPEELMQRIEAICDKHQTAYVITHEWAAQLYAPFLSSISQVKCRIFPNAPLSLIARELNAREVNEGSNWGLIESESIRDMEFSEDIRGLRVESPILAYLDLLSGEGRAKELAEHLRKEKISF